MMPAPTSAGLLMFRRSGDRFEVLLVHPGGPYWKNKDDGAWSIPKGLLDAGEDPADEEPDHGWREGGEQVVRALADVVGVGLSLDRKRRFPPGHFDRSNLELVRKLNILSTPTTIFLDRTGKDFRRTGSALIDQNDQR